VLFPTGTGGGTSRRNRLCSTLNKVHINAHITVLHGSASAVVKVTSQVTGEWQSWRCQNSVSPEPINMKYEIFAFHIADTV